MKELRLVLVGGTLCCLVENVCTEDAVFLRKDVVRPDCEVILLRVSEGYKSVFSRVTARREGTCSWQWDKVCTQEFCDIGVHCQRTLVYDDSIEAAVRGTNGRIVEKNP